MVGDVDRRVAKLQIEGTDVEGSCPTSRIRRPAGPLGEPAVDMTVGKTAAQVGHAVMLGATLLTVDETLAWAPRPTIGCRYANRRRRGGHGCSTTTVPAARWRRDAGFHRDRPRSVTVIAARGRPWPERLPLAVARLQNGVDVRFDAAGAALPGNLVQVRGGMQITLGVPQSCCQNHPASPASRADWMVGAFA